MAKTAAPSSQARQLRDAEARAEKAERAVYDMATSRMTDYVQSFVGFVVEKRMVRQLRDRAKDVADELREAAEGDQVISDSRRDWYRSLADRLDDVAYVEARPSPAETPATDPGRPDKEESV